MVVGRCVMTTSKPFLNHTTTVEEFNYPTLSLEDDLIRLKYPDGSTKCIPSFAFKSWYLPLPPYDFSDSTESIGAIALGPVGKGAIITDVDDSWVTVRYPNGTSRKVSKRGVIECQRIKSTTLKEGDRVLSMLKDLTWVTVQILNLDKPTKVMEGESYIYIQDCGFRVRVLSKPKSIWGITIPIQIMWPRKPPNMQGLDYSLT